MYLNHIKSFVVRMDYFARFKSYRHIKSSIIHIVATLALALSSGTATASDHTMDSEEVAFLEQGWNPDIRELYYYTPQGSRLMPYSWFVALEQPNSMKRFTSVENLTRFGWLKPTGGRAELNPGELPVGFAIDPVVVESAGKWVGLTCAACHTNDVTYKGKRLRIDGAPALADFGAFVKELTMAVNATLLNENKFKRFATNVLSTDATEDEITNLRSAYLCLFGKSA